MAWFLCIVGCFCLYLAFDAWNLSRNVSDDQPYRVTAAAFKEDVSDVPLHKQEELKHWNRHFGLGRPNQAFPLWLITAIGSFLGALYELLG